MQYTHLASLFRRNKSEVPLAHPKEFFKVQTRPSTPYIEPTLGKIDFTDSPAPAVVLISAVGATGKTRLATDLSSSTSCPLPLLDLSLCGPVGKDTLTGIITKCYDRNDVSRVLTGLAEGTYGIIIDAVDEGRAKVSRDAFNTFLVDLIDCCSPRSAHTARTSPTFILLGRTAILEECWYYLDDAGVRTALAMIEPFSMDAAREYIDRFTGGLQNPHHRGYKNTRDDLLRLLQGSFGSGDGSERSEFLRFLGYPPVLDSIVALLREKENYHALDQELKKDEGAIEAHQVYRIATYVLERERSDKVLPIVRDRELLAGVPDDKRTRAEGVVYTAEEQCARLVAVCLGQEIDVEPVSAALSREHKEINRKYNEALTESGFLVEHPFLDGCRFRNDVFKSLALATCFVSNNEEYRMLACEYATRDTRDAKSSYHLVYMLSEVSKAQDVLLDSDCLRFVLDAALEFRSVRAGGSPGAQRTNRVHSVVDVEIRGVHWADMEEDDDPTVEISIELSGSGGEGAGEAVTFTFASKCDAGAVVELGTRLAGVRMTVPCVVSVGAGGRETEIVPPVTLSAKEIKLDANCVSVMQQMGEGSPAEGAELIVECETLSGSGEVRNRSELPLRFLAENNATSHHSVVKYVSKPEWVPRDPDVAQKFLRLKRILLEFRSHGKGALARYCEKIDGKRVLKNNVGAAVRDKLIEDGVMYRQGQHYYLDPARLRDVLGISWSELRGGGSSEAMRDWLANVQVLE